MTGYTEISYQLLHRPPLVRDHEFSALRFLSEIFIRNVENQPIRVRAPSSAARAV